jgi:hypothetical protein
MNRIIKKLLLIAFLLNFISCFGDTLKLEIKNLFDEKIKIRFVDSNTVDSFKAINIETNKTKKLKVDFSSIFYLNLSVFDDKNEKISDFQILHNYPRNKKYNFVVPAGGALTDFKCAWNNNKITIKRIQGYEYYSWLSWLPWLPIYDADIKITVVPNTRNIASEDLLEFTLFALPVKNIVKRNKVNSNMSEEIELNKERLSFKGWGIGERLLFNPMVFNKDDLLVRWVDLIIHNYSANSWILYGIEQNPDSKHIKFNYPELFNEDFTVFFPPQSQLRGPGFRFAVSKEKGKVNLYPLNRTEKKQKDKFYFVIGMQNNFQNNDLEYISLELTTKVRLGGYIENGVNIKGYENYVYQAGFIPVNVGFSIKTVEAEEVKNKINIPVDDKGKPAFKLVQMKDVRITKDSPASNSKMTLGKTGMRYIVSGKSVKTGKVYKYRLILIAPPFLAGNTPGNFSPNKKIGSDSNIGNYLRYPLHLYLIPINGEEVDVISEDKNGKTELPNEIIGSIEYFISDNILEKD